MTNFPINKLKGLQTPLYYYDIELLKKTLNEVKEYQNKWGYHVHYAMKANANSRLLAEIREAGLGVDCVSGNEVQHAVNEGFDAKKIVYAGVGKADWEIKLALEAGIGCFNVESFPEAEVINEIAGSMNKTATVALRINPNVDAHTHAYITTGLEENKFGIGLTEIEAVIEKVKGLKNIELCGMHFHIGSQITDMGAFMALCTRVNELLRWMESQHVNIKIVNVGGGLGIDYEHPDVADVPNFKEYFETFHKHLELRDGQELHFELGRAIVAQCGSLITKVLYVKEGRKKKFAIVDAGMNDLIRPALYHAYHKIENLTSTESNDMYDVVGPVCESSDCFGQEVVLPQTKRGDLIAIRSAGAYGEVMASKYNLREFANKVYSIN